jgi:uncharacterized membrane protein YphA (DoxX/SURF4 family)
MLSIFPELLDYSYFSYFLNRFTLSIFVFYLFLELFKKRKFIVELFKEFKIPFVKIILNIWLIIYFFTGLFLLIGLYTQIASIILCLLMIEQLIIAKTKFKILNLPRIFYYLFFILSLSQIFLGGGPFGFDLPF